MVCGLCRRFVSNYGSGPRRPSGSGSSGGYRELVEQGENAAFEFVADGTYGGEVEVGGVG